METQNRIQHLLEYSTYSLVYISLLEPKSQKEVSLLIHGRDKDRLVNEAWRWLKENGYIETTNECIKKNAKYRATNAPFLEYLGHISATNLPDIRNQISIILDSIWFRSLLSNIDEKDFAFADYLSKPNKGRVEIFRKSHSIKDEIRAENSKAGLKSLHYTGAIQLLSYLLLDIAELTISFSKVPLLAKKMPKSEDLNRATNFKIFSDSYIKKFNREDKKLISACLKNTYTSILIQSQDAFPFTGVTLEYALLDTNAKRHIEALIKEPYFLCIPIEIANRIEKILNNKHTPIFPLTRICYNIERGIEKTKLDKSYQKYFQVNDA